MKWTRKLSIVHETPKTRKGTSPFWEARLFLISHIYKKAKEIKFRNLKEINTHGSQWDTFRPNRTLSLSAKFFELLRYN